MQFSPETQPVKDTAVDQYVEQLLALLDKGDGVTVAQIEEQGTLPTVVGNLGFSRSEIEQSLGRLAAQGLLDHGYTSPDSKCRLSEEATQRVWRAQNEAQSRIGRVVDRVFRDMEGGAARYLSPFVEFLCQVFSQLGDAYVRQIRQEITSDELLSFPSIHESVHAVASRHPEIDEPAFRDAVFGFMREVDPDYDSIKWNFAQNYYVAKVLGLDPSGYLLSKEVFGEASLYLDTNILIHALADKAQHHGSFEALSSACGKLGIELHVCQVSLDELGRTVDYHCSVLPEVVVQIPPDTVPKVRGMFFELYRGNAASEEPKDLSELFSAFHSPMDTLGDVYGVKLVDDLWFHEAEKHQATLDLVSLIRQEYFVRRRRPKRSGSALHDALVLQWIDNERSHHPWTWLVTLDTTLPTIVVKNDKETRRPPALTLDALLQWLSPLGYTSDNEAEFAAIFSEAISYQLLSSNFFDIRDFHMFAKMDWSCRQLPAKDVEDCIRYIRANASDLDPSNPGDREKLARELGKFFADPSREYHREVQRLEAELAEMRKEVGDRDNTIQQLTEKIDAARQVEDDAKQALSDERLELLSIAV